MSGKTTCQYQEWNRSGSNNGVQYTGGKIGYALTMPFVGELTQCGKEAKGILLGDISARKSLGLPQTVCLCPDHAAFLLDSLESVAIKASAKTERARIAALPFEEGYIPKDKKIQPRVKKDTPDYIDQIRKPTDAETNAASVAMDKRCKSIKTVPAFRTREASPYDAAREKTRIADIERQTGMRPDGSKARIESRMAALC